MSRARTVAEHVVAVVLLLLLSPVLLTCAAMAGVSLVWDEWAQRRQVRRERMDLAAGWGEGQ